MIELGPDAQQYREAFLDVTDWQTHIDQLQSDYPGIIVDNTPVESARLVMATFEEGAAKEFAQIVEAGPSPAWQEARDKVAADLRASRMYQRGLIDDAYVDSVTAKVPLPEEYNESDQEFATAFFVGRIVSRWWVLGLGAKTEAEAPVQNAPAAQEQLGDSEVRAKLLTASNVLVINDKLSVPLGRVRNGGAVATVDEEEIFETARTNALLVLARNPEKRYLSGDLWKEIMPTDRTYKYGEMQEIVDFLGELRLDDTEIVKVWKKSPDARTRYYQWGELPFLPFSDEQPFELSDEPYDGFLKTVCKLPNGTVLTGRNGRLMHLLLSATKENPVSQQVIESLDFSDGESDTESTEPPVMSAFISGLTSSLRSYKADEFYVLHRRPVEEGGRALAYWMERVPTPEVLSDETLLELAKAKSLVEALFKYADLLSVGGNEPPEESLIELFSGYELPPESSMSVTATLAEYLRMLVDLDVEAGEKFFANEPNDPRWKLANYLESLITKNGVQDNDTIEALQQIAKLADAEPVADPANGVDESDSPDDDNDDEPGLTREQKRWRKQYTYSINKKSSPFIRQILESLESHNLLEGANPTVVADIFKILAPKQNPDKYFNEAERQHTLSNMPVEEIIFSVLRTLPNIGPAIEKEAFLATALRKHIAKRTKEYLDR